jgi:hypothetical protein
MTLQWLCNTCAANSAIHRTRRARAQEPGTITNGVVWHQMECEGCVEPGGPNIKDDPPETPFGKRTRPQSPDHSPEGLECKRNKESPGSGGKSTTRILRSAEKTRQSCILKECKLPVATGMCPANGKPKQACCSRHYHLHKRKGWWKRANKGCTTDGSITTVAPPFAPPQGQVENACTVPQPIGPGRGTHASMVARPREGTCNQK